MKHVSQGGAWCSIGVHNRNCLIAIKTVKHIDHAAFGNTDVVIDRIKLTVKRHLSVVAWTAWPLFILQLFWLSTKLMSASNFLRCLFELWHIPSLIVERLSYQFERGIVFMNDAQYPSAQPSLRGSEPPVSVPLSQSIQIA